MQLYRSSQVAADVIFLLVFFSTFVPYSLQGAVIGMLKVVKFNRGNQGGGKKYYCTTLIKRAELRL